MSYRNFLTPEENARVEKMIAQANVFKLDNGEIENEKKAGLMENEAPSLQEKMVDETTSANADDYKLGIEAKHRF